MRARAEFVLDEVEPRPRTLDADVPEVAIVTNLAIPFSETFVKHQVQSLRRHRPVLCAFRQVSNDLPGCDLEIVNRSGGLGERAAEGTLKLLGRHPRLETRFRRASVVHAHFGPTGFVVSAMARRADRPLLVTLHGFDVEPPGTAGEGRGLLTALAWRYRDRLWRRAHTFICVSRFIRERAVAAGFPAAKCRVLHMGIPLDRLAPAPSAVPGDGGRFRIVAVGRLVPCKGLDRLIDALAVVEQAGVACDLSIVGDGPLRSSLEAQAHRRLSAVTFHGARPHPEVIETIRSADLMCHASVVDPSGMAEAFGLVLLEAQALGVPVVAFRSGGVGEAVAHGETGLLVDGQAPAALAKAILMVLRDRDLRQRFAAAAPGFVRRNFDVERQTRFLEDIYDGIAAGARWRNPR